MRIRFALLPIVFSTAMLLGQAEDLAPQRRLLRLEYIHFDSANQSVEWGVSAGTINEEGEFVPNQNDLATYLINLQTGQMQHAGQDVQMSRRDSVDAARVFDALALLMQSYTDRWNGSGAVDPSADRPASQEEIPTVRLYGIAAQCSVGHCPQSAGPGERVRAIPFEKENSIPLDSFRSGAACIGWPIYPGLKAIALRGPQ